ncbi:two component transcriptional regulator, LuxR family [Anaerobranca californiensis DSM 14826]|jgi:DNA-binding NarL/FixJ family response regulator|uniref:Stage 0 sporulation protein A homolog n=1 Tax=Anaerobranca californiensis DSM 14826 TaxID=1120989 RepID=A0A1M6Q335_9FIRM|nr:response regulator transcription factor [Anaerobranca californiensis]SHK14590.1 two component transcriptional regulator, LuxR family [Anaerobranca californiensis DSM 14826]
MEKIKIVVVEDHKLLRQGIIKILDFERDFEVVGQGENGEEGCRLVERYRPHIVLMDINMPKMNGIEATKWIKTHYPATKVIMLTIHDGDEYILEAIKFGAEGYMLKDLEGEKIIEGIRNVYTGDAFIHPTLTIKLFKELQKIKNLTGNGQVIVENVYDLTDRELVVYKLMAEGKSNKEIGDQLNISEKTVKNHVSRVFKKLGVYDRTQAVVKGIKEGFVKL